MFEGKLVIITGGSSGVGKELAQRLVQRGASLALLARDEKKLRSVAAELEPAGRAASRASRVWTFACDVTDCRAVEKTMSAIAATAGSPDILINSAGILREGYFEKLSLETFREIMDTNFFGTLHCIRAVLPLFKAKGGGRIVNLSSMAGLVGCFGYSAYCSSKYAVTGLTNTLRSEFKPRNIRFHLVCPPEFDSPMVDALNVDRTPENRAIVNTLPTLKAGPVADAILHGIEKEQYEIIPGLPARLTRLLDRLLPTLGAAIVDRRLARIYRGPDAAG
jgi:3-dehydrosphinganine reductase